MPAKLNKDQQWKTVAQGLALGCLHLGADSFRVQKMIAEFAFAHAWRGWSRESEFPSVSPRDFYVYVAKSARRNGVLAQWDWQGDLVPRLSIDGWGVAESLEVFVENEAVSAAEWVELARDFVAGISK